MAVRDAIATERIDALIARESARFREIHPQSRRLGARALAHLPDGVPMHWMSDWGTEFPLFLQQATGARLRDVDGIDYADFCLGDTGAMFGHSPPAVAEVLRARAGSGFTAMLPGEDAIAAAENLAARFGLPYWQFATTASDANRFLLRVARAASGRRKLLVFHGCYHGAVDETFVRLGADGRALPRPGQLAPAFDPSLDTRVVEFNDLAAVEAALADGEVAALLTEPALTNIGIVPPAPGFLAGLRALTRRYGTLLLIDETHTISAGPGGCTRAWGLEPDGLVLGKPLAGGLPASAWGLSAALRERLAAVRETVAGGHSGMGTTLSANALTLACVRANLEQVMTAAAYADMFALADRLEAGLNALIARFALPWCVVRLGARMEIDFTPQPPRNGSEAAAAMRPALEQALHLYLLNRGLLVTPFHTMLLLSPHTAAADIDRLCATLGAALAELTGVEA
ncbi:aspartate aminotransferase family protein [Plasticicumulans acidivorans]|uniref:Glutamate-1-semialdehyde 2,1-aminomutase n=1 Tax=Plasticicumulans acidivorans TaxID=886464 RepID=A0A317MSJ1_9GAMM|nr:aspartate aminotransferase family protein [Plasticicumulans acidivorans]PWV59520.1 glutamate-1-semialdehyde 2,1-aminomutase [Plasticicumulans acidivorans]